jgi:hypothetical protein
MVINKSGFVSTIALGLANHIKSNSHESFQVPQQLSNNQTQTPKAILSDWRGS